VKLALKLFAYPANAVVTREIKIILK